MSRITRPIRQPGLRRFAAFFHISDVLDFAPYTFKSFTSPRLSTLDRENIQAPSALLELFYTWMLEREHVRFLADFDTPHTT